MSYLFAVLIFSFLILIHELGHFAAAKSFGVQVNEFSLFMGPAIWQKQLGETLYSLRLIPFGGYCAMEGEDGDSVSPRSFGSAAWWKRLIVLVAGAAMNFVAGVAMLAVFFAPEQQIIVPRVSVVEPGCSLAENNGVQVGDVFYAMDGERIYVHNDFYLMEGLSDGPYHDFVVLRDGKKVSLPNVLMEKRPFAEANGETSMRYGFSFSVEDKTLPVYLRYVWDNVVDNVRLVRLSLGMLLHGRANVQDMAGPVGIVQQMGSVAQSSGSTWYAFLNLMYFGGFIAINLAVMNLLPIPALDGGRAFGLLLTVAIETVTRRKLNPKYEGYVHAVGMIVLLVLMALIMFKDIFSWIRG